MEIAVGSVLAVAARSEWNGVSQPAATSGISFANVLQSAISDVGAAENAMGALAAGKQVELHDVMIAMERAQLSVQTFVQVRNKLVEAYQDLMRMQL